MVSLGAVPQRKEEIRIREEKKNPSKNFLFLAAAVLLVLCVVVVIVSAVKAASEKKAHNQADTTESVQEAEEELTGYWESIRKVKAKTLVENVLMESGMSEENADAVISFLGMENSSLKLSLVFYEDGRMQFGLDGNFIGDASDTVYTRFSDTHTILVNYDGTLGLPSVRVLGFEIGLGEKNIQFSHAFAYEMEDGILSIDMFGEKIRFQKGK